MLIRTAAANPLATYHSTEEDTMSVPTPGSDSTPDRPIGSAKKRLMRSLNRLVDRLGADDLDDVLRATGLRPVVMTGPETMRAQWDAMRADVTPLIFERDGHRCAYCGQESDEYAPHGVDHGTPICRGGTNDWENLYTCCSRCNSVKGTRTWCEFIAWQHGYPAPGPDHCEGCKAVSA